MNTTTIAICCLFLAQPAFAQQIRSRSQLKTILDDQIIIDDFESISVHSGSSYPLPNPTTAANSNNAIQEGLTFTATTSIDLYGGFSNGDDDVFLRVNGALTIQFGEPQLAIGIDLFSNISYSIIVRTRDDSIIEQLDLDTSGFFGYNASTQGISSVTISPVSNDSFSINNLTFGAAFIPCPADLNNDNNQDFLDISAFLSAFINEDDLADYTDDGQFDFLDISAFLTAYSTACP